MGRNGYPNEPPPTAREKIVAALVLATAAALFIGGVCKIHSDVMQAVTQ
jgi:hypothetical protein